MFRIHRKQQKCASKSSLNICVVKIIQGGAVAAPVGGKILNEVLPYLELKQDNEETKEEVKTVTVPDITYKTLEEAEKILKENELTIQYEGNIQNKKETIIKQQTPSSGITINSGSSVKVNL